MFFAGSITDLNLRSDSLSINPPAFDFSQPIDVIIVGAGAAGLYTALCLPASLRVVVVTKDTVSLSASDWAQGGIAAVTAPDDSDALHIEDTLRAGAGLCDWDAVKFLVEQAPQCVRSLIEMGVAFDREAGDLALTLEAAHSRRRVLHAADTTGHAIVSILTAQVLTRPNIQILPQTFVFDLWLNGETGDCQGVSLVYESQLIWVKADAVILATGGGGQVFAQTTNPTLSTGDGVAIASRSGAKLRDLEFMQFHPTALTKDGAPRFLISEAVRGEGAHLVDKAGHRFTFDYHPDGELAPRDVVSRAIFSHLQRTEADPTIAHVWLDLRPIPVATIHHRFPNIIQVCQKWGVDVFQDPIPVAPAAHYWMGGVVTDLTSLTSIPRLYAVGETASTGVHGANRLASNSLLECLVFGGQLASLSIPESEPSHLPPPKTQDLLQDWSEQVTPLESMRRELPRLMWQSVGICRDTQSLLEAIDQVKSWQQEFDALPLSQAFRDLQPGAAIDLPTPNASQLLRVWGEVRNLLEIGYLILRSAHFRTESRGGHYRLDYARANAQWQVHTVVQNHRWKTSPIVGVD